jgi:DNA polymerase I-like protein with 3'-5' exonuclease and polymerase domains
MNDLLPAMKNLSDRPIQRITDIPEDGIIFYDIETTHQYAAYCDLTMIGVAVGFRGEPFLIETQEQREWFASTLADPSILKIAFNNINFDDIVLCRHKMPVSEEGRHDLFLIMKTIAPALPAYGLKFLNWYYFGDPHFPELDAEIYAKRSGTDKWAAPMAILGPYCLHDIVQTRNLFCMAWEVVQRPRHWKAYTEVEAPVGLPLEEIVLRGGEFLDRELIEHRIGEAERERDDWNVRADFLTEGKVRNANSTKQVGDYLVDWEGFELDLTENGQWSLPKKELLDLREQHPLAECTFQVRRLNNKLGYYRNYLKALNHCPEHYAASWIPKSYSTSRARTRRILSDSMYGINFQNASEEAKEVQVVPQGWLGGWIDSTQVENVVHIYESNDVDRRQAYESDPDWSEYVWLCNRILGTDLTKKVLDDKAHYPSNVNPTWSIYKQYKTVKLGLNFGMGPKKYAGNIGVPLAKAEKSFEDIHRACPAIRQLTRKLTAEFARVGYVTDVFGHIYKANPKRAYKIVAYLIQGCGTGSLPKAQLRRNYDTLHQWDHPISEGGLEICAGTNVSGRSGPFVDDEGRGIRSYGVVCGTTHDECAFRISLGLGKRRIIDTLTQLMYNMTELYSPLFDGIPLRAKLKLSRTYATDAEEFDVNKPETYDHLLPC